MKTIVSVLLLFSFLYTNSQTYFLNGTAQSVGNDCYLLTSEFSNENGTVWYADQINLSEPFDLQFLMNFGTLDAGGADGICFVLQTVGTSAIGQSGGGLGYLNFGTSLGIEFDTWQNGEYGDPAEDHIAIEMNGDINHTTTNNLAAPVQADPGDVNIEDGEDHVVRVTWDPELKIISVFFDCEFRTSAQFDMVNIIFNGEPFVYWGFTAATGGSWNNQAVCLQENILNVGQDITVCEGGSVMLNAGSSIDGVYEWTPSTYLDDPTSPTPIASPPGNTQYYVSFLDLCGQEQELQFNITVTPLEVTVTEPGLINCITESTTINADINFNSSAMYQWIIDGDVLVSGQNLDSFEASDPGSYEVHVIIGGCTAEASFEVDGDLDTYDVSLGEDLVLNCFNDELNLVADIQGNNPGIQWQLNGNNISGNNQSSIVIDDPGTYTVDVTHPVSGCASTDEIIITQDFTTPSVTIGEQDSLSCVTPVVPIDDVIIVSENEYSVSWTTQDGVIAGLTNNITTAVSDAGTYTITVTDDETGCTATDNVYVGVELDYNIDLSSLSFPNIITNNGDSKNESWHPFLRNNPTASLSTIFGKYELKIYNRWGDLIFESESYNYAWSGSDNEEGVFFYTFRYETLCDNTKKGDVEGFVHLLK